MASLSCAKCFTAGPFASASVMGNKRAFLACSLPVSLLLSSSSFILANFNSCPPHPQLSFFWGFFALPVGIFPACVIVSSYSRQEEVGLLKLDFKARIILPLRQESYYFAFLFRYKRGVMGSGFGFVFVFSFSLFFSL